MVRRCIPCCHVPRGVKRKTRTREILQEGKQKTLWLWLCQNASMVANPASPSSVSQPSNMENHFRKSLFAKQGHETLYHTPNMFASLPAIDINQLLIELKLPWFIHTSPSLAVTSHHADLNYSIVLILTNTYVMRQSLIWIIQHITSSVAYSYRQSGSVQFRHRAACRLPMIGWPLDSHRIALVILYFLRSESIRNLYKAWFSFLSCLIGHIATI